jgi:hypothetical protein
LIQVWWPSSSGQTLLIVLGFLFLLPETRNPNVIRSYDLGVGFFGPDLDALEAALPFGLGEEDQVVLVVEVLLETIEIGFEADRA